MVDGCDQPVYTQIFILIHFLAWLLIYSGIQREWEQVNLQYVLGLCVYTSCGFWASSFKVFKIFLFYRMTSCVTYEDIISTLLSFFCIDFKSHNAIYEFI